LLKYVIGAVLFIAVLGLTDDYFTGGGKTEVANSKPKFGGFGTFRP
jgi:hypothetical protein